MTRANKTTKVQPLMIYYKSSPRNLIKNASIAAAIKLKLNKYNATQNLLLQLSLWNIYHP